jgi:tetratricopeptide (TPR) repeat protein
VAHDDDASRAVAAALHIWGAAPDVGIGGYGGEMRGGADWSPQRRTYGVLGDKTNLAARLMVLAEAGTPLCDDTVYRQARHTWEFAALPPVRVKGKAGPIAVYRPTGRQAHGDDTAPGAVPLVGRRAELAYLNNCLNSIEAGGSRVLILEGEAGIGKSRLVAALGDLLRERGLVGLVGSAHSPEQATYRAWRAIFMAFFGLDTAGSDFGTLPQQPSSPGMASASTGTAGRGHSAAYLGASAPAGPLERWARVRMHALAVVPDLVERLPLLNDVLGLGLPDSDHTRVLDVGLRGERLGELLLELLRAWAVEQPLVLVLEDAQHLDTRARELAVQIARSFTAAGLPLLLVVALHTLEAGHPAIPDLTALLGLPGARLLHVAPLSPEEIHALAAARLEVQPAELPAEVSDLLRTRAGGNPLFAEELIATLREQGLIRIQHDAGSDQVERAQCVVVGDIQQAGQELPDKLQRLLLARIDRLPPEERLTLKVASALGPSFEYQPLRYARDRQAPIDETTLKAQLRALAAKDFIELETPEPGLAYRFKHILSQEAAYQTLLYAQRRELHRSVASWYEQTFGGSELSVLPSEFVHTPPQNSELRTQNSALAPYIALLAYHYRQAEDRERERQYVARLGVQAFSVGAFREAIVSFQRALDLTPQDDRSAGVRRAWLSAQLARAYTYLGKHDAAGRLYQESLALTEASGDIPGAALACYELGALADRHHEHAKALGYFERALSLFRAAQDPAGEGRTLDRLGGLYVELGDETRALAYYQEAIALGRRRKA